MVEAVGMNVYHLAHVTLREELSVPDILPKVLDTAGSLELFNHTILPGSFITIIQLLL